MADEERRGEVCDRCLREKRSARKERQRFDMIEAMEFKRGQGESRTRIVDGGTESVQKKRAVIDFAKQTKARTHASQ